MDDMDAVYRRHARTVYKFLLAQCHDPDLAEELTQETFYQAVRSVDRFDGSCKLSVWLCQIAKVVYLRAFGDLSFREIGDVLGRTETWARVTFYRCKEKLRNGGMCDE